MIPQLLLAAVQEHGHLAAPAQGRHLPEALRLPGQKHKVQPRMLQDRFPSRYCSIWAWATDRAMEGSSRRKYMAFSWGAQQLAPFSRLRVCWVTECQAGASRECSL